MHRWIRFAVAMWTLGGAPAQAAEIFYLDHDEMTMRYVGATGPLVLSGDIEPGDFDRLLAKLRAETEHFLEDDKLIVAVTGGDVQETLKIAKLLQSLHATVNVERQTGACAGPCFLLFAAAAERLADAPGLIGLDRPSPAEPDQDAEVRTFLEANRVPARLIEQWFAHAPGSVYWMTDDDAAALKSKSDEFVRYLKDKCAWDEALEREAVAGGRAFDDLKSLWSCRRRVVAADARVALRTQRHEK